jgi:hypothetical protein
MNPITITSIHNAALSNDAVGFDAWCDKNKVDVTWLDVTLTDFNDGYYNVELPAYNLEVCYCDGLLEHFFEIELNEN